MALRMSDCLSLSDADKSVGMRIVIHGGMHKTGTTSVQNYLRDNREFFLRQGIAYPAPEVSQAFILNPKHKNWSSAGCTQQLHLAKKAGATILLMSAEIVSTLSDEQFRELTECFDGHDITYVFSFRHWREYLPSRWSQYCRRRDSQSFGSYFHAVLDSDHVDLRYDAVLSRAVNSGRCRVVAVSYDNAMMRDQSIVPMLLRAAGVSVRLSKPISPNLYRSNTRPPQDEVELTRIVNGVVASSLQLPQDDLFNSFNEHRMCKDCFDFSDLLRTLDNSIKSELVALIAGDRKSLLMPENWQPSAMAQLNELHGHRFLNKINDKIFPAAPETKIEYSATHWSEIPQELGASILRIIKNR